MLRAGHIMITGYLFISIVTLLSCTNSTPENKQLEVKREKFSFSYPGAWTIDTAAEDFDPDALFSLDHKDESSSMTFILMDTEIDSRDMVEAQEEELRSSMIKNPDSTNQFYSWGKYKGEGIAIAGKALGVMKYVLRVFVYSDSTRSFIVLEQVEEKNKTRRQKDFELVRNSFQLH